MDVFTNALEGVRQYFQGLPAATGSTAGPAYQQGNIPDQTLDRSSSGVSYWPPQTEAVARLSTREETSQRPPSHHSEPSRPPSHHNVPQHQLQQQHESKVPIQNSYANPSYHEASPHSSQSFQFSMPQARDTQTNVSQQHYQSHILPNISYHQSPSPQQSRTHSRQDLTSPHSYHQLQPPQNPSQQYNYPNQLQNRSYYPVQQPKAKPVTPTNTNYKVSSTQSYNYDPYKSYVSQSSLPPANVYTPPKITTSHTPEIKQNNQISQTNANSQPHRTHNLPPIAALSNYPISRSSREALRVSSGKSRTVTSTSTATSQVTSKTASNVSASTQQLIRNSAHADNTQQSYRNTTPQYTMSNTMLQNVGPHTSSSYYTDASTSSTTSYSTSAYFPSSTNQNVHVPTKVNNHDQRNYQVSNHPVAATVDSVLDLSLKTIKTSADSTLDDSDDVQRNNKYYQSNRQVVQQVQKQNLHRYSTNDGQYANQLPRNAPTKSLPQPSASAPKFDFLPNFNVPLNQNYKNDRVRSTSTGQNSIAYDKHYSYQQMNAQQQRYNPPANTAAATPGSLYATQTSIKKSVDGLPRIDFPPTNQVRSKTATNYQENREVQRKRTADTAPTIVPVKKPKMDDRWKKAIDQQIEQKFSTYQSRIQDTKSIVNGNYPSHQQNTAYHASQYQMQPHSSFTGTNQYHQSQLNHNQTYVPSAVAHQYPGYHPPQQQQSVYQQQNQQFQRINSHPSLSNRSHAGGGADKRVLSILRSNLEMKGAKEAQKKLEQGQQKSYEAFVQRPREIQHPSMDVMAPLQPKPGIVGRQNVSPFTASSLLERNSNTPPTYKCPKAIDSVRFESEIKDLDKQDQQIITNNTDLDGLAANLAARIRTKGELKQVAQMQQAPNKNLITQIHNAENYSPNKIEIPSFNGASIVSPPKLSKEKQVYPPRRRLFSKTEEDLNVPIAPPRDKTGLRSSSETSVFDFPDSDSETEMPALEDMRRDRKSVSKQSLINENDFKDEPMRTSSPFDVFDQACDSFVEQLRKGGGKKRGRRKKMVEADVLAKLESVTKEKPLEMKVVEKVEAVETIPEPPAPVVNSVVVPKVEEDTDSDVPLIQCVNKDQVTHNDVEIKTETTVKKTDLSSDSDSESENTKNLEEKRRNREIRDHIRKSNELTALIELTAVNKSGKKPAFGDGSDFYPGWEEELYRYKKSLRMPSTLIHVTRPPNCHRLSTSLPDLDPCPLSPSPSSVTDNMEYCKFKTKTKSENFDSDMDSNSSFNFSFTKTNYDSEEGSSSVKSLNVSNKSKDSILDRLLEKYVSSRRRRRTKKKDENNGPKILPKADNKLELLPTPSLELKKQSKKSETVIKGDSVFFGFRKNTIKNFKDAFIKNSSILGLNEHLTTVVLATRTRTETRVLKQKATIREVFGEDRPASAPPVTCVDDLKESKISDDTVEIKTENPTEPTTDDNSPEKQPDAQHTKEVLKNKLLNRNNRKTHDLLKALASKNFKSEFDAEEKEIKQEVDSKSETPSLDGEDVNIFAKKRNKLRNMRRKGSSGFDYIRKKKKAKKENNENETAAKPKRRGIISKASPESVQDIQKEIKMWVLNKGIGETHLHRSARLGYTDVTAYCLEKMECSPSPKDNAGYTPLHEACSRGHLNIAKLLLKYGANVSESAQGGIRPLHEAAENGYVEIVRLLLSYGADPMLATYSGSTPLSLATEESTVALLTNHVADIKGQQSIPWSFNGPASCFDSKENGYDPLSTPPEPDPVSEEEDVEFEVSDIVLPNLYTLQGEPHTERWVLLQDLSALLKIKSRDALMKQINPPSSNSSSSSIGGNKSILREMKMSEFLERAHCCQFLNAGEKINSRSSKIALVKYTEKVRQLLNVEKVSITVR